MNKRSVKIDRPVKSAHVLEPSRRLPVSFATDVVVAGGGIAGVAAAVAAARAGVRVCLLEKECALGGLATLGLVIVYLPLCDGLGHQVSYGLAEELLKLSVKDPVGAMAGIPAGWRRAGAARDRVRERYVTRYNAATYILELDRFVGANCVRLLFDTRVCSLKMTGKRIGAVIVENKSGRSAIRCRAVVDATGDADVCAQAGEPTVSLRTNVACGWYYAAHPDRVRLYPCSEKYDTQGKRVRGSGAFAGDDAADVTAQALRSRQNIATHLKRLRARNPGENIYPVLLPAIPCVRMTRRLDHAGHIMESDAGRACSDTVGMIAHWRKKGMVYHLPYRSLAAARTANLLAAGRCITVDNSAWDLTRVIPACAVSGQAAGVAAAMVVRHGGDVQTLDVGVLQAMLRRQGCVLYKRLPPPPMDDAVNDNPADAH